MVEVPGAAAANEGRKSWFDKVEETVSRKRFQQQRRAGVIMLRGWSGLRAFNAVGISGMNSERCKKKESCGADGGEEQQPRGVGGSDQMHSASWNHEERETLQAAAFELDAAPQSQKLCRVPRRRRAAESQGREGERAKEKGRKGEREKEKGREGERERVGSSPSGNPSLCRKVTTLFGNKNKEKRMALATCKKTHR
jgi:hypothetical protein